MTTTDNSIFMIIIALAAILSGVSLFSLIRRVGETIHDNEVLRDEIDRLNEQLVNETARADNWKRICYTRPGKLELVSLEEDEVSHDND